MADNTRSGNRNERNERNDTSRDQRTQAPGRQDREQQRGSGKGMDQDVSHNQEGYQRSRSDSDSSRQDSGRSDRADRDQSL